MASNEFAERGRAKKVRALCLYFDVEFARLDVDPIRQAGRVVKALREMTPEQWVGHAIIAGQKPPSLESQSEIIAVYVAREFETENVVAGKRIGGFN